MAPIKFNEEFAKVYENPSLLGDLKVDETAHIELDPVLGQAVMQSRKVRQKIKDDFKEQDEMVDKFISDYELKENPDLPKLDNKKELKAMKLAEQYITEEDVDPDADLSILDLFAKYGEPFSLGESLQEDLNPNSIHDFIDEYVSMEELGNMAYRWMTAQELTDMLERNGYENPDDQLEESLKKSKLNEDYSNFIGKPLKDFLYTLKDNDKVNIDCANPVRGGSNGFMGWVDQVSFKYGDRLIKDIQLGDENYYKFKILTESKKLNEALSIDDMISAFQAKIDELEGVNESLNEDLPKDEKDPNHKYKVVAAYVDDDGNDKEVFIKDVTGIKKVENILKTLTDEKLNELGATMVYVNRDDNKEIYYESSDDNGNWEIDTDYIEFEKPVEERDCTLNHIMADLNAESTPDQVAFRKLDRSGEGYVGFDEREIGFDNDVIHLKSQSDKPIDWAKKVADFYGYKTSEVKVGSNNYKYIDIFTPGLSKDPLLVP